MAKKKSILKSTYYNIKKFIRNFNKVDRLQRNFKSVLKMFK